MAQRGMAQRGSTLFGMIARWNLKRFLRELAALEPVELLALRDSEGRTLLEAAERSVPFLIAVQAKLRPHFDSLRGELESFDRSVSRCVDRARASASEIVRSGSTASVELLATLPLGRMTGVGVDAEENSLMHLAVLHNRLDAAKVLAKQGRRFDRDNAQGLTPLCMAAALGRGTIALLLLEAGYSRTCKAGSALALAADHGHLSLATQLLSRW